MGRREPRGAQEYTGGNAKYLQVSYGCLCEVSKTYVEGWVNPINQMTGETIPDKWIKVYKALEGWVNKLEWYDKTYGEKQYLGWNLHMEAGGVNYILDLALRGMTAKTFMFSARNIDFNVPLEFAIWTDNSDGKLAVWLKQNDQTVYQFYKKGDMKNCPPPIEREGIGGKKTWDWAETERFLWDEMQTVIAPAIEEAAKARAAERGHAPDYSHEGEPYTQDPSQGNPTPAAAPSSSAPPAQAYSPTATTLGDMVTTKQLGMIKAIAYELNLDPDKECATLLQCSVGELSKRGASDFIDHLQQVKGQSYPAPQVAAAPAPPANPTPALHPPTCTCPQCDIPF